MDDTKKKIMDAASRLFLKGGLKALSVRAIAREAGLSTIGIYSHFEGKQGILDALYIEGFQQVADVAKVEETDLPLEDVITLLVKKYLHNADRNEAHYRLIFSDHAMEYTPSGEAEEAGRQAFTQLVDLIASILQSNSDKHCREVALEVWALAHGFVSIRHHVHSIKTEMDQWEDLVTQAVASLIKAKISEMNVQS